MRLPAAIVLSAFAVVGLSAQSRPPASLDQALRAFWAADSGDRIDAAIKQVIASGATFDEIAARLKTGREYGTQRTGRVDLPSRDHGISLDNVLEVPADYNPSRPWPLRVSLHGGVGREAPGPGDPPGRPLSNRIPSAGELVLHPRAWAQSEWWTAGQVENIARLIDRVKRQYNVDESRIYVTGISDGGTGVYFFAMRAATTWAACIPLNGHPLVLANPDVGADGQLYAGNMVNCPLHAVNGGRDPLYPADSVQPFIDMFRRGGVPVSFQVYADARHDTSWWPQERPQYETFLAKHPRAAHPERISWETERVDRYNRFRWLVIDQLGPRSSDMPLPDVNRYARSPGRDAALYDRSKPSGRVDAVRRGNAFELQTRGVRELTLLLSPDVIDFAQPVRVSVNGRAVNVTASPKTPATLLKWAARDNDRTMLYGAELRIAVP
jgi:dienelactone hydrolase